MDRIKLETKRVSIEFPGVKALDDIDFEVTTGEIRAVVGANGAGKSTLLKCIAGLLKPQGGQISYNSEPLPRSASAVVAKGIALVPEGRWIFPNLTVEENLLMGGYLVKNRKEGLEKAYSMFGRLKERHTQRAGTMSGGEQQMLAVGRALMSRPKLMMLDEPSLGLAPIIVEDIFELIMKIRDMGKTILLIEQNASMALSIADRGYVLETGKIIMEGKGKELLVDPKVKAAYLGA